MQRTCTVLFAPFRNRPPPRRKLEMGSVAVRTVTRRSAAAEGVAVRDRRPEGFLDVELDRPLYKVGAILDDPDDRFGVDTIDRFPCDQRPECSGGTAAGELGNRLRIGSTREDPGTFLTVEDARQIVDAVLKVTAYRPVILHR